MHSEIEKIEIKGIIGDNINVLVKIEYNKYVFEKIITEIYFLEGEYSFYDDIDNIMLGDEYGDLFIKNQDNDKNNLILKNIVELTSHKNKAIIHSGGFEYSISNDKIKEIEFVHSTITLCPSYSISKKRSSSYSDDGSINYLSSYKEEIKWKSELGDWMALDQYSFIKKEYYKNNAIMSFSKPIVTFTINTQECSLKFILDAIMDEIEDVTSLLSLCNRRSIQWGQIQITPFSRNTTVTCPVIRKYTPHKSYQKNTFSLIDHADLINSGFEVLLKSYKSSNIKNELKNCILFLSLSYLENAIEINFFHSIIALECLCDGLTQIYKKEISIPSSKWKTIESNLKITIESLSSQDEIAKYCERLIKKLPELKRPSVIDKIVFCTNILEIEKDDIWNKLDFNFGLQNALYLRNKLFHMAHCDDVYLLNENTVRIQILTERLILKHLGWPDEKLGTLYSSRLQRINRYQ
ncbi:hypothetical protein SAMN04488082_12422 [Desulfomicrobium apsheronum]|uniref:ApeA N-terminal domain-containing protein n=1 Tax=Desulfomicrobium apsheronum TaxID=52560 RepID=A0A1I3ZGU8_9BACT|nr:hypothetical protein [Desulfomicrobium apsheronum]SFK43348.1 hypothetical protein SAMN04488082_12422 [Desulfomicrobium apsheronum]